MYSGDEDDSNMQEEVPEDDENDYDGGEEKGGEDEDGEGEGDGEGYENEDDAGDVDEDEGEETRPSKRPKLDRSHFFENEAEVSGDEGGEDEEDIDEGEDEYDQEFVDSRNDDGVFAAEAGVHHAFQGEQLSKEELGYVQSLEQRQEAYQTGAHEAKDKRIPGMEDPKLFLVPCKIGKEMEVCLRIMKRFAVRERGRADKRFLIKSAFTTPASKGYVYIEAYKSDHIQMSLQKLEGLKVWKSSIVPLDQMVAALTIKETVHMLRPKQWVRMKQGVYKGDLAQILSLEDQDTKATVRVIPRIDFAAKGQNRGRRRKPQAALFNKQEVEQVDPGSTDRKPDLRGGFLTVWRNSKFDDAGFLIKTVRVSTLQVDAVNPRVEEWERFRSKGDDMDPDQEGGFISFTKKKTDFRKGDRCKVVSGDLMNITGRVTKVVGDTITVYPELEILNEPLDFNVDELKKIINEGDHVKIISGKHKNETGLVLAVDEEEDILTVFSDVSSVGIKVYASNVVEAAEVSAGRDTLGNYRLHDMVMLGPGNFVVIVKVENNGFKVMDTSGKIHSARLQDVGKKRFSRNSVAYDSQQNQVTVKDSVNVIEGEHQGKKGEIKHILKFYLFLYNRRLTSTSGIFVVQARMTLLVGQRLRRHNEMHDQFAAPRPRMQRPRMVSRRQRNSNLGEAMFQERVIIVRGRHKGFTGIVKDVMETTYQVELDAKPDRVTVRKDWVKSREEVEQSRQRRQEVNPYLGRETPLIGSQTPRRDDGGRTPIHDSSIQDGSMTPGPVPSTPSSDAFNPAAYADDDNNEIYTPAPEDAQTPRTPLTAPGTTTTPYTPQTNPLSPYTGGDGGLGEAPFTAGPATPVTPTPNTPYTPGVQDEDEQGDGGIPNDVAVIYNGQRGVVRGGSSSGYEVEFQSGERRTVTESKLQLIRPSKNGLQVKIIKGRRRGQIGKILSSSEESRVIQLLDDHEMLVFEAAALAEYVPA